ncbi:GntR family transcriptional regulator [Streptomyces iconiensis]|uniref:GntR family transcriptional regulator n=1 Tax=Streptomyces iconiensis TaxID=1384038 RepID=A0ABT7A367_9ACTN|nr:GntR family transcriptional regulator [Streptomyces iconiensis]MDJ1135769.1 GntR family transcriptional regulator [Streptomyces iconiensis]
MADTGRTRQSGQVVEDLTTSLAERIANGEFPLGTWMRQAKVAEDYGVSRTPASLALSRLEAMGVLERVPNRGFRVRYPSPREIMEVFEVRAVLEGHAAYLAAGRITEVQLQQLWEQVAGFRRVVEMIREGADSEAVGAPWRHSYSTFHQTLFEAAGNSQLHEAAEALYRKLPRKISWRVLRGDPRSLTQHADEHEDITTAIEMRDGAKARQSTIAHIEAARELIIAHLPTPEPGRTRG